jgi:hypothetical protein
VRGCFARCTEKSTNRNMEPTDHMNTLIHRAAQRYTEEQMRILLCMRDMVKEEVKKEVARQIKMINKQ